MVKRWLKFIVWISTENKWTEKYKHMVGCYNQECLIISLKQKDKDQYIIWERTYIKAQKKETYLRREMKMVRQGES